MQIVTREMRRQLERENVKRPAVLTPVPREQWPLPVSATRTAVLLSRKYLVQVFDEGNSMQRISVNRTTVRPDGRWDDGLTWDEMQEIKRQIGMGDKYAIEVYPRDRDVVNVANMRHLWVLAVPLHIGWVKTPNAGGKAASPTTKQIDAQNMPDTTKLETTNGRRVALTGPIRPDFTEGICGDGAAILKDGLPMTITQILDCLKALDFLLELKEHKDLHGISYWYLDAKAIAWKRAKQAIGA